MVTAWGALVWPTGSAPKFRAVGDNAIDMPIPVRVTLCGVLAALAVSCNIPAREPFADLGPTGSTPKFRAVGDTAIDMPIPVRVTLCGLLAALSVSCNITVREPFAAGVNPTV